jgi:hypothetical protein
LTFAEVTPIKTGLTIKLADVAEGARMTKGDRPITPAETARRRTHLQQAEHSGEMEGLYITAATRADGEDYAAGRIDIDKFVALGRARYGLPR